MNRTIPNWSWAIVAVLVLGLVGAYFFIGAPGADKDTLVRLRTRPGGTPAAVAGGTYGLARGIPILHQAAPTAANSRMKPGG
jgi:hypothetical protein